MRPAIRFSVVLFFELGTDVARRDRVVRARVSWAMTDSLVSCCLSNRPLSSSFFGLAVESMSWVACNIAASRKTTAQLLQLALESRMDGFKK